MAPESLDTRMNALMNRDWYGLAKEVKERRDRGEDMSFSKDKVCYVTTLFAIHGKRGEGDG
jgi:hypothetical protein